MHCIETRLFAIALLAFVAVVTPHGQPALAEDAGAATATLYERLGSWDGIEQIVTDTIANHRKNPAISHYFADMGLSDDDFDSAVADILLALDQNGIGDAEKAEVASILESLRPAVMGAGG